MRAVMSALVAMIIYAFGNVMLDQKLKETNTFALLMCWYGAFAPVVILGLGWLKVQHKSFGFPKGELLGIALAMGVLYMVADTAYVSAYTIFKGSLMTVTSVVIMAPVGASIWKKLIYGGWPNKYEVASYIVAGSATLLAVKGSDK